jgi:hypothetical protein
MREEDLQQMGGGEGSDGAYGDMEAPSGGRLQGAVADGAKGFLASRNIGWLMELEEEAEGEELRPIMEELDIDPADIKRKILCVLLPTAARREQLAAELSSDSDFWGPLFCVLAYVLVVVWGESSALSWSLWLWVGGAFGVFVVARALGGEVSYSHCASAIGYSLLVRSAGPAGPRPPLLPRGPPPGRCCEWLRGDLSGNAPVPRQPLAISTLVVGLVESIVGRGGWLTFFLQRERLMPPFRLHRMPPHFTSSGGGRLRRLLCARAQWQV